MAPNKTIKANVEDTPTVEMNSGEDVKRLETLEAEVMPQESNPTEATITTTETTKACKSGGGKRSISYMCKVIANKTKGKKTKVTCNEYGVPIGETRHTLQSYVGMLARTMVPIDKPNWPSVEDETKKKIWEDIEDTFTVPPEIKNMVLKSAGVKWRQFKTILTSQYVLPYIGQKKKLIKPPKKYPFICREVWRRFVAERNNPKWLAIHRVQSERVGKRKYPHCLSRKGYIGLQEEEIRSGKVQLGEVPDRAILWKKARISKNKIVDEELSKINDKIDSLLELQRTGQFKPNGSQDVLATALEKPEHSGRVRGVGGYINPTTFFHMPKGQRMRITKAELMARDRQRTEEMDKKSADMDKKTEAMEKNQEELKNEIAELKAMMATLQGCPPTIRSPKLSSKASCHPKKKGVKLGSSNAEAFKQLELDDDCKFVEHPGDFHEKKDPIPCELSSESINNKVAFGRVFTQLHMNETVHGVPLQTGQVRVAIDGTIKPDAELPIPSGNLTKVHQAVGSFVAWPEALIVHTKPAVKKRIGKQVQNDNTLTKPNNNVPKQYKVLYKYVTTLMKTTGASIQIPCDHDVFGCTKTIFLLHENIIALLEFNMVGQAVISAYMAYLHSTLRDNTEKDTFAMVDPGATAFTLTSDFQSYMVKRLKEGNPDRLFFVPHNENMHWTLSIVWEDEIYVLNPLPHTNNSLAWENSLTSAMKTFNAQTGRGKKVPKVTNLLGCPKQPGGIECGYVVMRYMKDIIADKELSFATKWITKSRKSYTMDDLEVVRTEALDYIQDYLV